MLKKRIIFDIYLKNQLIVCIFIKQEDGLFNYPRAKELGRLSRLINATDNGLCWLLLEGVLCYLEKLNSTKFYKVITISLHALKS